MGCVGLDGFVGGTGLHARQARETPTHRLGQDIHPPTGKPRPPTHPATHPPTSLPTLTSPAPRPLSPTMPSCSPSLLLCRPRPRLGLVRPWGTKNAWPNAASTRRRRKRRGMVVAVVVVIALVWSDLFFPPLCFVRPWRALRRVQRLAKRAGKKTKTRRWSVRGYEG